MPPDEDKDWEQERIEAEARGKKEYEADLAEANRAEEARADARADEEGRLAYAEFVAYQGDDYFVSAFKRATQFEPLEAAVAEVQSVEFICFTLGFGGLEYILADKHASAGLRAHIINGEKTVLEELARYAKRRKPKGKRGRKKPPQGYFQDLVVAGRSEGKTFGRIALDVFGDSRLRNKASALYSQAMKKKKPPAPAGT